MKNLITLAVIAIGSSVFGQNLTFPTPGDGSVDHLVPTTEQMARTECNENATYRETWREGPHIIVRCEDREGNFFIYAKYIGSGTGGGGIDFPTEPTEP